MRIVCSVNFNIKYIASLNKTILHAISTTAKVKVHNEGVRNKVKLPQIMQEKHQKGTDYIALIIY